MNSRTHHHNPPGRQSGLALFTALMLLLITTIIGLASVRTGVMEAQMATNEELRINAFETAESTLEGTFFVFPNFQVAGGIGRRVCTANWVGNCDEVGITLPLDFTNSLLPTDTVQAAVERMGPLEVDPPPGFSVIDYRAALFKATGRYDGTAGGRGKTEVQEGVIIVYPKPN